MGPRMPGSQRRRAAGRYGRVCPSSPPCDGAAPRFLSSADQGGPAEIHGRSSGGLVCGLAGPWALLSPL